MRRRGQEITFKQHNVATSPLPLAHESDPNDDEEPITPPLQTPVVDAEWESSNYQYNDAKITWSTQAIAAAVVDISDDGGEEERDNYDHPIARSSTVDDLSDNGEPTQGTHHIRAEPEPAKKKKYTALEVELYKAALKGDWKTAKSIFDIAPSAVTMKITDARETALHIAAGTKHISFLEKLIELTSSDELAIKNKRGYTALAFTAISGTVKIAKLMIDKNPNLPNLNHPSMPTPVVLAVAYKHKEMASFLFSKTDFEALDTSEQLALLTATLNTDYYDIALDILKKKPKLATERIEYGDSALHALARKPSAIGSSGELSFWKRHINSRFKGFYNKDLMQTLAHQIVEQIVVQDLSKTELSQLIRYPSDLLHAAARVGNAEFLIILIRSYPDLLWAVDHNYKSIFHVAVENRQENVFSLIYEIGGLKDFLANFHDREKNSNILHLAGFLAAPHDLSRVSGAALQMQRELLWFKEVEKIVASPSLEMRCAVPEPFEEKIKNVPVDGLTPRELFSEQHGKLVKDGEEWMKNTANSCMLVATLIATVVFAAAFTVPGGNDDKDGIPIFRQTQAFTVFVISDVVALVMSTTSILSFLSILTSRYAEDDFLVSLPTKLLVGLVTLFISIACMVVAFSATFFIAYDKTKVKMPLAIGAVAMIPVGCFCVFHSKLVVDILRSTYWSKFSFRPHKRRLF